MKNTFKLAFAYLVRCRKQTISLFIGILLSVSLLTGVGSLFLSGKETAKENARREYGDWHYNMRCDYPWFETFQSNPKGKGFKLEKYGVETVKKEITEPFEIQYVSADDGYLNIMGRKLQKGNLPDNKNEMAMDTQTLRNLGISEKLGTEFELDGEIFTLCGILTEMPEKIQELQGNYMQVFVSPELDYGMNGRFLYLKFDESSPVYQQIKGFTKTYSIDGSSVARNNGISAYVGGSNEKFSFPEMWNALKTPDQGIPFVWVVLNENEVLTETVVLILLAFFSVFVIYSIFQVSVLKRLSQYSILQTLGMTESGIFSVLLTELLIIFLFAYVGGCILGNTIAMVIYHKIGRIFITRNVTMHSGVATGERAAELSVSNLPETGIFHINQKIILYSAVFLILFLMGISLLLVKKMHKLTLHQMLVKETSQRRKNRKIYSLKHENLTDILVKKFMFTKKGMFLGILFSLSVGSVIFLGATYVTENARINNELTFATDDGLGSDIQVYEASDCLSDTIPEQTVEQLRHIEGVETIHPVGYMLGEIPLDNGMLKWTKYFAETAGEEGFDPDPEIMEKYNGQIVQTGEDDYRLKVNIYGYDDQMLEELKDYLLEGEIDPDQMRQKNTVIFKTLMGGQGDYNGIDIGCGDSIQLRTPSDSAAEADILRFQSAADNYHDQNFKVNAIVSRPMGKVETYIGDQGSDGVDIIMTNEQMKKYFHVTGYQTISISLKTRANASAVADTIRVTTSGIPKCIVKDYTTQIETQNLYLNQQMMFFYGIAAVLLGISLFHIMNSMQYLIAERKHEFSILRAMGITDSGFLRMLMKEGLRYGVYSSFVILLLYFFIQKVLYYFMTKVYLYLHPQNMIEIRYLIGVIILNLTICIGVIVISGKNILKKSILE